MFGLLNVRSLNNKTFGYCEFVKDNNLDFFIITESWLNSSDTVTLVETTPPNYSFFHQPRMSGRVGGGIAVIHKDKFKCSPVNSFGTFTSFEMLSFVLNGNVPLLCVVIYRPPKGPPLFLDEFSELLSIITPKYDRIAILGDFNIHVCCPSHPLVKDFITIMESFNLVQSVCQPTHNKGHILDLILSSGVSPSILEFISFPKTVTDHKAIIFNLLLPLPSTNTYLPVRLTRILNSTTATSFAESFLSVVPSPNPFHTLDELVHNFHNASIAILDTIAPLKAVKPPKKASPWLNDHTRLIKRRCRQAERKWKADNLHISHDILKTLMAEYQSAVKVARSNYFSNIISTNGHNPRTLFKVLNSVTNPTPCPSNDLSNEKCAEFLNFFLSKVENIRSQIIPDTSCPPFFPNIKVSFNQFSPVTNQSLEKTISSMKPSSCKMDPIPTKIVMEAFYSISPHILAIINTSLSTGSFPSVFKLAIIQPLLKKPSLDPSVLNNYRPISKLSFLSKVLEKIISSQLITFMTNNDIFEQFQSGFRALHSTETALIKITNDLLLSIDDGECAILVLLDLSAAFDTVNHSILLTRLEKWVGVQGTALELLRSYLTNRTFSVVSGENSSPSAPLTCGVPQGSVLGPLLFSIYMLELGYIIRKHKLCFHCYADDSQIYVPIKSPTAGSLDGLRACLMDINSWMSQNFLQLNSDKTEILLFGPPNLTSILKDDLGSLSSAVKPIAKSLGVFFDPDLSFTVQVNKTIQSCFYQLRTIAKIKSFLSSADLEKLIHAFITSRLDYCNGLYTCLSQKSISRLQLVQNAAARLLTNTKKRDHITPVLATLHWLPVVFRIDFKILLLAFKAQNGLAPQYITDLVPPYIPNRTLRSSEEGLLKVRTTNFVTRGDRAFAARAPKLWNNLPLAIRKADTLSSFKTLLKTHLFRIAFPQFT